MVLVGVGRGVQLKCSRQYIFVLSGAPFFDPQNKKNPGQMSNPSIIINFQSLSSGTG